jgi:hypothetical protein
LQDTLGAMLARSGERHAGRIAVDSADGQRMYTEVVPLSRFVSLPRIALEKVLEDVLPIRRAPA